MKLVTLRTGDGLTRAGLLLNETVLPLNYSTVLALLRDPQGLESARAALEWQGEHPTAYQLRDVTLLAPIPEPPTMRDFYAFEQHVKTARAQRGLGMHPA